MAKSLRLSVGPRALTLGRILMRGEREFKDLHPRDKEILMRANVSLKGLVPQEQIEAYRMARQLQGREGTIPQIKARIRQITSDIEPDPSVLDADQTTIATRRQQQNG